MCPLPRLQVVTSTLAVYEACKAEFPPTLRSHYTFNWHQVTRVFMGMMMVTPDDCEEVQLPITSCLATGPSLRTAWYGIVWYGMAG